MKTEIGQLKLSLPSGFEKRASRIGRLVGADLARQALPPGRFDAIRVGPVRVDQAQSDRAIASAIAGAIVQALVQQS